MPRDILHRTTRHSGRKSKAPRSFVVLDFGDIKRTYNRTPAYIRRSAQLKSPGDKVNAEEEN